MTLSPEAKDSFNRGVGSRVRANAEDSPVRPSRAAVVAPAELSESPRLVQRNSTSTLGRDETWDVISNGDASIMDDAEATKELEPATAVHFPWKSAENGGSLEELSRKLLQRRADRS